MTNTYADLATLKSPAVLNVPDDAHDARLLAMLDAASRWIDGYCDRRFSASHETRRFDGAGRSSIAVSDLVSVSALRVRDAGGAWQTWPAADWLLYPLNSAPTVPGGRPYTRVMLASGTRRRFPLNRAGIEISGVWGYGDVREDAGLQVSGDAAVAADAGTVAVSATDAAGAVPLSAGHTIRIDDEQLHVGSASADEAGVTTLAVRRGVNGTTAATHAVGVGVSVYRYPQGVAEACLLQAAAWWRERLGGPFRPPGGDGEGGDCGVSPLRFWRCWRHTVAATPPWGSEHDRVRQRGPQPRGGR